MVAICINNFGSEGMQLLYQLSHTIIIQMKILNNSMYNIPKEL